MKKLLFLVLACYGLNVTAQVSESKNFVYLYNDSVIYARHVRLRPDFFNSLQLRVDSRKVPLQQVKFFNNEEGFFANTHKLNLLRGDTFAERVIEGKINLFQEVRYDPYLYADRYGFQETRANGVDLSMYYNKGYGDLKNVNYRNLKYDMADRPESMALLEGYRKSINTSKILYVAAGASIVASLVTFLTNKPGKMMEDVPGFPGRQMMSFKKTNFTTSFVLLGLGAGMAGVGGLINLSGARRLERAVDSYNR